jgi:O-antigen biosynthesis protein WbqP
MASNFQLILIRFFDFLFSFLGLLVFSPVMLLLSIIGYFYYGSPLFLQERVGRHKKPFTIFKFRTMHIGTPSVATHLVHPKHFNRYGLLLRNLKLDELPQLLNVLFGNMSIVGPRPNLFNQEEVLYEREIRGVYNVLPGITGLSQIRGINMSKHQLLAETDEFMVKNISLQNYFMYITLTALGLGRVPEF